MGRGARTKIGLLAAVAAASFMLGCGGSDGKSEPLTKQAFIQQANAICDKGVKEKDKVLEAGFKAISADGKEPAEKDLERLVLDVIRPIEETTEKLGELTPPAKDEATVEAIEQKYEEELKEAREDPSSALEGGAFMKAPNEAAQKYGLTSCVL
jgi:hypothetical protein